MSENKDFEKLMNDYYTQMQQLIEKKRRTNNGSPQTNSESDSDTQPQNPNNEPEQEKTQNAVTGQSDTDSDNQSANNNPQSGDNMPPADAFGSLAVQVTTARGAVPIENALVVISEDGEDGEEHMLFTLQTSNSGETQTVRLATYPFSLSQNPEFFGKPYKDYTITTSKPGYYTVVNKNVPVFADRFSIQPVNMIALPENFTGDTTIVITEREPIAEGFGGQPQTLDGMNGVNGVNGDNKEE